MQALLLLESFRSISREKAFNAYFQNHFRIISRLMVIAGNATTAGVENLSTLSPIKRMHIDEKDRAFQTYLFRSLFK